MLLYNRRIHPGEFILMAAAEIKAEKIIAL